MTHHVKAMTFVLSTRLYPDAGICIEYCIEQGYIMDGVIQDDWAKACEYLYAKKIDVIVVASDATLDPDRTPRVEVVAHQRTQPQRPDVPTGRRGSDSRSGARTRRTRAIRRRRSEAE